MKLTKKQIITLATAAVALVTIILFTTPAIAFENADGYSLFNVMFGHSTSTKLGTITNLNFSFGYFLVFLFVLAALVLLVVTVFVKLDSKIAKILTFVAAGLFVLAGIFSFLALAFVQPANDLVKLAIENTASLGAGAVICGILAILCGGAVVANEFLIKE